MLKEASHSRRAFLAIAAGVMTPAVAGEARLDPSDATLFALGREFEELAVRLERVGEVSGSADAELFSRLDQVEAEILATQA